jgi:hypothetical protein
MNEVEQKIHTAISEIRKLLPTLVHDVEDTDEIRHCTTNLCNQLMKVVGNRVIKESIKNAR